MTKIPFVFKVLIVFGALAGAVGVSAVAIDDSITPQNCDRSNPVCAKFVETTSAGQIKWGAFIAGGLRSLTNLFVDGKLGVGTLRPSTGEQVLKVDVEGAIGARFYCDQDGNHCVAGDSLGQGGNGGVSLPTGVLDGTLRYDGSNWVPSFLLRNSEEQVGIGMDPNGVSSTYKLGVNGGVLVMGVIKIAGGNPANGKVLTSTDASGNATWQTPTSNNGSVNLTPGIGITLTPNPVTSVGTISIDFNNVQKRLSASCSNTSAIKKINIDGTVECQAVGTTGVSLPVGTFGQTLVFNNSNNLVSNSLLTNTGTEIGINNASPKATLDVKGSFKLVNGNQGMGKVLTSDSLGNANWATLANSGTSLWTANSAGNVYRSSGKVGIGTNDPAADLDVKGIIQTTKLKIQADAGVGKVLTSDYFGYATWQELPTNNNNPVNLTPGIGITLTPNPVTSVGAISIDFNNVQKRLSASCSNTSAIKKINIDGTVECQAVGTTGVSLPAGVLDGTLRYDGSNWVPSFLLRNSEEQVGIGMDPNGVSSTYKLGVNGGVLVMGVVKIAGGNPGIGKVLTASDASGNATWQALPSTGGNVSITTNNNSGIILSPTTITNTGTISIDFNNVQKRLSASCPIGQSIQGVDANGSVTCADNGSSNAINWTLSGSKLYPDSISYNVGIGTTNPTAKLDVAGTLKTTSLQIVNGTQGTGKVLTSDYFGYATWQTPVAGGIGSFASCQQYRCIAYRLSGRIENKNEKWTTKCYKTTNENNTDDYPVPVSANVTSDVTFNFKPGVKDEIDYYSSGKVSSSNNSVLMSANVACGRNDSSNGFRQSGSVLHSSSKVVTAVCDEREKRAMVLSATYCPS